MNIIELAEQDGQQLIHDDLWLLGEPAGLLGPCSLQSEVPADYKSLLDSHSRLVLQPDGQRLWKCSLCNFVKIRRSRVKEHLDSKHFSQQRAWNCVHCGAPAKSYFALAKHVQKFHTKKCVLRLKIIPSTILSTSRGVTILSFLN